MVEAEDVFRYQVEGYNGVAEYADLAVEELEDIYGNVAEDIINAVSNGGSAEERENIYMLTLDDEVVIHKSFVFADI